MWFRLGPEPDVRGDPEHQVVCGEEDVPRLVVQNDLVVRVPRNVDDANFPLPHRQFFARPQRENLLRQRQGITHHGGGGCSRRLGHAVPGQVLEEWSGIRGTPDLADKGDLALHHADWCAGPFAQPPRCPEMIRMEVCHHDALYIPRQITTDSGSPCFPRLTGRRVIVAGVHQGPADLALDEIHGDEAKWERYRQLELPDTLRNRSGLSDRLGG